MPMRVNMNLKFWRTSITAINLELVHIYVCKCLFIYVFICLQLVKQAIMPRVHGLALKTTVAAVRSLMFVQDVMA